MEILLKTNFGGTNFPAFRKFWRKTIPKKFSFKGPFAKVDTWKDIFSNSFTKINEILLDYIYWILLLNFFQ